MKEKLKRVFLMLLVSLIFISFEPVYAWQTGGYTGGGGASGGGTDINHMTDGGSGYDSGVYLFQLVYKPKSGDYYEVGNCVVINTGIQGRYNITDIDRKASSTASANGCSYGSRNGSLLNLAVQIQLYGGLDNVPIVSEKTYAEQLVNEFGQNIENMKQAGSDPGNFNSYGYRILVQKLTCFGYSSWDINTWCAVLWPRKSWAAQHPNLGLFGSSFQGDLFTTKDDMGIRNATNRRWYTTTGSGSDLGRAFADRNRGEGYNIIGFNPDIFKQDYDFSVDAACVNCNVDDAENKSYIIQDSTDWNSIMYSGNVEGNAATYYIYDGEFYCREEYHVFFPNVNNTIFVEPGRYFTLNPTAKQMENIIATGIPNLKPIRVTKIRECKRFLDPIDKEHEDARIKTKADQEEVNLERLRSYASSNKSDFIKDTGTVTFKYNEVNDSSLYNMSSPEELVRYSEPDSYSADILTSSKYSVNMSEYGAEEDTISSDILVMKVTYSYALPQNYYQYVRMQDGLSMKRKPTNDINELQNYINLGLPNLPVSFNNTIEKTGTSKAADIQFAYELPDNARIKKAYNSDNSYLDVPGVKGGNIYSDYINGGSSDDNLEVSACRKMFGNSSGFDDCARQRVDNKIGTGSNSCIYKNDAINSGTDTGYACIILKNSPNQCEVRNGKYYYNGAEISKTEYDQLCNSGGDGGNECETEEDAIRLGRDWNPKTNSCCPVGTNYNPSTGDCESGNNTNNTCRIENGKYYDFSGNEISKEKFDEICPNGGTCYVKNGKYYDFNGNEITKEEYDEICPGTTTFICPTSECPYGCCPSGECAPMPDGTCPGSGGLNVIYRPIDLTYPFPGQDGSDTKARATGANWCAYNVSEGRIDCSYDNDVSNYYIINKHSKVYTGDALYEVVLDTDTISNVRNYNDKTNYDDWDLKCKDNGKACISDFLNEEIEVEGLCKDSNKSNFYSCDKVKKGSD